MKQIDKMLRNAKVVHRAKTISPVHIIEDGYCYACKGECKYINNEELQKQDNVVIIINDIPKEGGADRKEEDQTQTG